MDGIGWGGKGEGKKGEREKEGEREMYEGWDGVGREDKKRKGRGRE